MCYTTSWTLFCFAPQWRGEITLSGEGACLAPYGVDERIIPHGSLIFWAVLKHCPTMKGVSSKNENNRSRILYTVRKRSPIIWDVPRHAGGILATVDAYAFPWAESCSLTGRRTPFSRRFSSTKGECTAFLALKNERTVR